MWRTGYNTDIDLHLPARIGVDSTRLDSTIEPQRVKLTSYL